MRKGLDVRIWMLRNNIQSLDIVNGYGCDKAMVSRFINGERTSKGLAEYFINKGCPEKYFKNGRVAA